MIKLVVAKNNSQTHSSRPLQIAIDGPVAAGKSTVAKLLSKELKLMYIDTGAMYRAVALAAQQAGIDWQDAEAITAFAQTADVRLARPTGERNDGRSITVYINDEDVSWKIREIEYGEGASIIGQHKSLRKVLVKRQQEIANDHDVVMEGRDIGSVVLPNATLKVFMTAHSDERVRRKKEKLEEMGLKVTVQEVKSDVISRDKRETTRKVDPLKPTADAWILDTTELTIEQVVEVIVQQVKKVHAPMKGDNKTP